jgi:hypothetical protein
MMGSQADKCPGKGSDWKVKRVQERLAADREAVFEV